MRAASPSERAQVEFEKTEIVDIALRCRDLAASNEDPGFGDLLSEVARDPTGIVAACCECREAQAARIEFENLGLANPAQVPVSKAADGDDVVADQRRRVEIRRRKCVPWVEVELQPAVRMLDGDVIVDAEVSVIRVLMLAGDVNGTAVRKTRACAAKAFPAP